MIPNIRRHILFPGMAIVALCAAYASLFFNEQSIVLSFITFMYLITVPGYLILTIMRLPRGDSWDTLLYSVGFSLLFLMVPGLIFNWVWPLFSPLPPLETGRLTIWYSVLTILLSFVASLRSAGPSFFVGHDLRHLLRAWYFLVPPLFTIVGVFSAFILNNGGSNILAIVTLSGVGLAMLCTVLLRSRIAHHFLPWSLYWYSLGLLLMLSMRSNYVSGWDIQSEFGVFQLTKNLGKWSPGNMRDAYNACMSISLLPTIISRLTFFPDDYIYKLLYQIVFAFTPVIVYKIYVRYTSALIGFVAVVYVIAQPLFIQPMTALMRQEIAFLFFALMIWSMFSSILTIQLRTIIFLVFGTGMVLSHYSTTYVTLLLILSSYPLVSLYRLSEKIPFLSNLYTKVKLKTNDISYSYFLNPVMVGGLILLTLFWYGAVNNQLGQVTRVATEGLSRMNELFRSDVASDESRQAIPFAQQDRVNIDMLRSYAKSQLSLVGGDSYRLYPPESYRHSDVHPIGPAVVPPVFLSKVNYYVLVLLESIKQFFKLCVILAPLYLLIMYFRKNEFSRDYIVICTSAVMVIVVMTFHPYFGKQYNLSRFYLQLLFFLSLPSLLLTLFILYPLKKYSVFLAGILVSLQFVYLAGLPYQLFGGEARMYLNNFGADYDKFYVHDTEIASGKWLKKNIGKKGTLFMDRESNLRMFRVFNRGFNYNVMPALIYQDAYVYASYGNIVSNRTRIHTEGTVIEFSFPKQFLEENKSVIYSNGQSKIYQ